MLYFANMSRPPFRISAHPSPPSVPVSPGVSPFLVRPVTNSIRRLYGALLLSACAYERLCVWIAAFYRPREWGAAAELRKRGGWPNNYKRSVRVSEFPLHNPRCDSEYSELTKRIVDGESAGVENTKSKAGTDSGAPSSQRRTPEPWAMGGVLSKMWIRELFPGHQNVLLHMERSINVYLERRQ